MESAAALAEFRMNGPILAALVPTPPRPVEPSRGPHRAAGRSPPGSTALIRSKAAFRLALEESLGRFLDSPWRASGQIREDHGAKQQPREHNPGRGVGGRSKRDDAEAAEVDAKGREQDRDKDQGSQDRNDHVPDRIELVATLADEEDQVAQVGEDVYEDDDERGDRAKKEERQERSAERKPEDDGEGDAQRTLHVNSDVRSLEPGVHLGERSRQDSDPAQREAHPRRGVGAGVRVGEGAVDDGEQHEYRERPPDLVRESIPRVAPVEGEEGVLRVSCHVWSEIDHGSVVADQIEDADQNAG